VSSTATEKKPTATDHNTPPILRDKADAGGRSRALWSFKLTLLPSGSLECTARWLTRARGKNCRLCLAQLDDLVDERNLMLAADSTPRQHRRASETSRRRRHSIVNDGIGRSCSRTSPRSSSDMIRPHRVSGSGVSAFDDSDTPSSRASVGAICVIRTTPRFRRGTPGPLRMSVACSSRRAGA
jgi:hypothetical protein